MFFLLAIILNGGESKTLGEKDGDSTDTSDSKQEIHAEFVRNLPLDSLNDQAPL
jgi:hypothetical protein